MKRILFLILSAVLLCAVPAVGAHAETAHAFRVTQIKQDDMIVGRCVTPAEFTVTSRAYCCTENQSLQYPWLLAVEATTPDGMVLDYLSPRDYYDDGSTPDGTFVMQYLTPALHYMTAAEYCDYWTAKLNTGAAIRLVEENTYPALQPMLRQQEQAYIDQVNSMGAASGLSAARDSRTVCTRLYYVSDSTGNYYFITSTATHGVWITASLPGPLVSITSTYTLWESPYLYAMCCPESMWEANRDIFTVFMENTSVNDQFLLANQRLSTELQVMMTGVNLAGGESYSRRVMEEATASGNNYNDERYTDYIFDQNDYTLSDGSHVKISTAYDYVYEGDNGVVYVSDSAFGQPGGSTQLTPNR